MNAISNSTYMRPCDQLSFMDSVRNGTAGGFNSGTFVLGAALGAATDLLNRVYCTLPESETVTDAFNSALSYLPSTDQVWDACPDSLCRKVELY